MKFSIPSVALFVTTRHPAARNHFANFQKAYEDAEPYDAAKMFGDLVTEVMGRQRNTTPPATVEDRYTMAVDAINEAW